MQFIYAGDGEIPRGLLALAKNLYTRLSSTRIRPAATSQVVELEGKPYLLRANIPRGDQVGRVVAVPFNPAGRFICYPRTAPADFDANTGVAAYILSKVSKWTSYYEAKEQKYGNVAWVGLSGGVVSYFGPANHQVPPNPETPHTKDGLARIIDVGVYIPYTQQVFAKGKVLINSIPDVTDRTDSSIVAACYVDLPKDPLPTGEVVPPTRWLHLAVISRYLGTWELRFYSTKDENPYAIAVTSDGYTQEETPRWYINELVITLSSTPVTPGYFSADGRALFFERRVFRISESDEVFQVTEESTPVFTYAGDETVIANANTNEYWSDQTFRIDEAQSMQNLHPGGGVSARIPSDPAGVVPFGITGVNCLMTTVTTRNVPAPVVVEGIDQYLDVSIPALTAFDSITLSGISYNATTGLPTGLPIVWSLPNDAMGRGSLTGDTLTGVHAGELVVRAYQGGNEVFDAVTLDITIQVGKAEPDIVWAPLPLTDITYGDNLTGRLDAVAFEVDGETELAGSYVYSQLKADYSFLQSVSEATILDRADSIGATGALLQLIFTPDNEDYAAMRVYNYVYVAKATAGLTLSDLTQTYTGTPRSVSVTTNPAGKQVHITYYAPGIGATQYPPSNAGTYDVAVVVSDVNYTSDVVLGALTITPAVVTITPDNKSKQYGYADPVFTYTHSGLIPGGVGSLSGMLARIAGEDIGTRLITLGTLTAGSNYALQLVSRFLTISPQQVAITFGNLTHTYVPQAQRGITVFLSDGTAASVTAVITYTGVSGTVYGPSTVGPTNAGTYTASVVSVNPNYQFTYAVAPTMTIGKAAQSFVLSSTPWVDTVNGQIVVYSKTTYQVSNSVGTTSTVAFTSSDPSVAVINPTTGALSVIALGTFFVTASRSGDSNYNAISVSSTPITVTHYGSFLVWDNPSPITYPTALSGTQLNAFAGTDGVYVYTPPAGTVLMPGEHLLRVDFTPSDNAYLPATAFVGLQVTTQMVIADVITGAGYYAVRWTGGVAAFSAAFSLVNALNPPVAYGAGIYEMGANTYEFRFAKTDPASSWQADAGSKITISDSLGAQIDFVFDEWDFGPLPYVSMEYVSTDGITKAFFSGGRGPYTARLVAAATSGLTVGIHTPDGADSNLYAYVNANNGDTSRWYAQTIDDPTWGVRHGIEITDSTGAQIFVGFTARVYGPKNPAMSLGSLVFTNNGSEYSYTINFVGGIPPFTPSQTATHVYNVNVWSNGMVTHPDFLAGGNIKVKKYIGPVTEEWQYYNGTDPGGVTMLDSIGQSLFVPFSSMANGPTAATQMTYLTNSLNTLVITGGLRPFTSGLVSGTTSGNLSVAPVYYPGINQRAFYVSAADGNYNTWWARFNGGPGQVFFRDQIGNEAVYPFGSYVGGQWGPSNTGVAATWHWELQYTCNNVDPNAYVKMFGAQVYFTEDSFGNLTGIFGTTLYDSVIAGVTWRIEAGLDRVGFTGCASSLVLAPFGLNIDQFPVNHDVSQGYRWFVVHFPTGFSDYTYFEYISVLRVWKWVYS